MGSGLKSCFSAVALTGAVLTTFGSSEAVGLPQLAKFLGVNDRLLYAVGDQDEQSDQEEVDRLKEREAAIAKRIAELEQMLRETQNELKIKELEGKVRSLQEEQEALLERLRER